MYLSYTTYPILSSPKFISYLNDVILWNVFLFIHSRFHLSFLNHEHGMYIQWKNDSHSNFWVQIFQRFARPWPNSCRISVLQLHRWWSISFHPSYMLAGVTCLHYICTFNPFNQTIWKLYEILMDVFCSNYVQICKSSIHWMIHFCVRIYITSNLSTGWCSLGSFSLENICTVHFAPYSKVASSSFIFSWAIVALV